MRVLAIDVTVWRVLLDSADAEYWNEKIMSMNELAMLRSGIFSTPGKPELSFVADKR